MTPAHMAGSCLGTAVVAAAWTAWAFGAPWLWLAVPIVGIFAAGVCIGGAIERRRARESRWIRNEAWWWAA